jgi:hypothetical protein
MKRTIALGAAWTVSAAAAVGLGFLAVSLVDASASPGAQPVAATSTSSTATAPVTGAPTSPAATAEYATDGGTVFADCRSGSPVLAGVPAAGWFVDDSAEVGKTEFTGGGREVEVRVVCIDGVPVFRVDDSSSSGRSPESPASSSPAPSSGTSGVDDSSGRGGGGHGSDDGPGDDSSGRGGGGHGSDD